MSVARSTASTIGVDAVADFLLRFVGPDGEQICSQKFNGCLCILQDTMQGNKNLEELRFRRPDLFSGVLSFLTLPRDTAQLTQLKTMVIPCRCSAAAKNSSPMSKTLHQASRGFAGQLRDEELIAARLCVFLSDSLLRATKSGTRLRSGPRTRKGPNGRSYPWPETTEDIFVRPPRVMLASIWALYTSFEFEVPTVGFFLNLLTLVAGDALTSEVKHLPSFATELGDRLERAISLARTSNDYRSAVDHLTDTLEATMESGKNREGKTAILDYWEPHAVRFLLLLTDALNLLQNPTVPSKGFHNRDELIQRITRIGSHFLQVYNSPRHPQVEANMQRYHKLIRDTCLPSDPLEQLKHSYSSYFIAYQQTRNMAQSTNCGRVECREVSTTKNKRFPRCSGCNIMSYCSRDCQRASWKEHKALCKALKEYAPKMAACGADWHGLVAPKSKEEVEKMSKEAGVSLENVREVLHTKELEEDFDIQQEMLSILGSWGMLDEEAA